MHNFIAGTAALLIFAALPVLGTESYCDNVSGNLVKNCGFETGTIAGWTLSGSTEFTGVSNVDVVHTGSRGMELAPYTGEGYLTQNIGTTAGDTYMLQFFLENPNGAPYSTPNNFSVSWNGTQVFSENPVPTSNFLSFVIPGLAATSSSTPLQFEFYDLPGYLGLDDIVVTLAPTAAVPEPASVYLVFLAGCLALILIRRKRTALTH